MEAPFESAYKVSNSNGSAAATGIFSVFYSSSAPSSSSSSSVEALLLSSIEKHSVRTVGRMGVSSYDFSDASSIVRAFARPVSVSFVLRAVGSLGTEVAVAYKSASQQVRNYTLLPHCV